MSSNEPHAQRRGWLRNGNRPGDPNVAQRCGARTRRGTPCQCPAMRNKQRCRLHGGASTGPRTKKGGGLVLSGRTGNTDSIPRRPSWRRSSFARCCASARRYVATSGTSRRNHSTASSSGSYSSSSTLSSESMTSILYVPDARSIDATPSGNDSTSGTIQSDSR